MSTSTTRLKILRMSEVTDMVGVSRVTLWRWCRRGLFVPKRYLGPNSVGFLQSEVEEWISNRPLTPVAFPDENGSGEGGRR